MNHHHHHPQQQVLFSSTPKKQKNYRNMHAALLSACLLKRSLDLSVQECVQLLVACSLGMCASVMANRARLLPAAVQCTSGSGEAYQGYHVPLVQRLITGISRAH